jgi:amino acid efflux transporter
VVVTLSFAALGVVVATDVGAKPLVLLTTGSFLAVYALGVAAAIRLLPRGTKAHVAAILALGAVVALLAVSGVYLLWPILVTASALLYRRLNRRVVPR